MHRPRLFLIVSRPHPTISPQIWEETISSEKKLSTIQPFHENQYKKIADVAVWRLQTLHECLLTKHHETFWIEVDTRIGDQGQEQFMFNKIEHTRNPIVSQFDILLEQSMITVDLLLGRPKVDLETGKPKKGGDAVSFKIKKSAAGLLFPDSTIYTF